MKILADEADDELVVARVEAVAGEANVVSELLLAVGHPDRRVLPQDGSLLRRRELRELSCAAQRVPYVPGPGFRHHVLQGPAEEHVLEVGLVAQRVGTPQHRPARPDARREEAR